MSRNPLSSSIATKVLIAATGIGLLVYMVLHIAGNLVVFSGPDKFNHYSHFLISNPLIYPLEIALAAVFLLHIYKAVTNYVRNRNARPEKYEQKRWAGYKSRKSAASTTMIFTGSLILLFIIIHLIDFRFGTHYHVPGTEVRDLYRTEMEVLSNPWKVALYIIATVLIGLHLWHGAWSALQSLGLGNERYTPRFVQFAKVLSVLIAGGFVVVVLWVFLHASRNYVPGGPL